jgi:cytochrome c-type biogenesis protein
MTADLNLLIAFAAGLLSFVSPCVLPLIPSYLSYVGGVSVADLKDQSGAKTAVIIRTLLFVLGFSIVFVVLGVVFSGSGLLFSGASRAINIVAGAVVVLLGLNVIFDFWKFLNYEQKIHLSERPRGYAGSVLIGMAFGAGWTPCIGPILAGILFLAGSSGQVSTGVLYLSVYSMGLAVPFILASVFFSAFAKQMEKIKRHFGAIKTGSGIFLIVIGLLISFGQFQRLNVILPSAGNALRQWHAENPAAATTVMGLGAIAVAVVPLAIAWFRKRRGSDVRVLSTGRLVFAGLFLAPAVLEWLGVIDLALVLASWLSFQGI